MIDFIKATKIFTGKDKPFFGLCTKMADAYGNERYECARCERIELTWNPRLEQLEIRGSMMYFWQGHNFSFSKSGFVEAINYLERMLQCKLWDSVVVVFEYGKIVEVDMPPKLYIENHHAAPKEGLRLSYHEKHKGNFRRWTDEVVDLKMYDAGRNIKMKQGLKRQEIIKSAGWNPDGNYLKFEAHYLKPRQVFNKGLLLADLVNSENEMMFKEDLYIQYKRFVPMSTLEVPKNKKDLSTIGIFAFALAENCINEGKDLEEVKKELYQLVKQRFAGVLSKADMDSRKIQIRKALQALKTSSESKWDISKKLEDALNG